MRVPRVRFTIRRMMLIVLAVALIFGGIINPIRIRRLRTHYRAEAARHTSEEELYRLHEEMTGMEIKHLPVEAELIKWGSGVNGYYTPEQRERRAGRVLASEGKLRADLACYTDLATYHAGMRVKYDLAATRPWAWIDPDPRAPPKPVTESQFTRRRKLPPGFDINAVR